MFRNWVFKYILNYRLYKSILIVFFSFFLVIKFVYILMLIYIKEKLLIYDFLFYRKCILNSIKVNV